MKKKTNILFIILILICSSTFAEPLQVITVSPLPNSEYVSLNTNLEITFNKEMYFQDINEFTFTLNDGYTDIKGDIKYFKLLKKAVFMPKEKLVLGRKYTATIHAGIRDLHRERLTSSVSWIFSTGHSVDKTRPFLISSDPADGEENIPLNSHINLTFSERILDKSYTEIKLFDNTNKEVKSKVIEGSTKNKVVLIPDNKLKPQNFYTVRIGDKISDLNGNVTGYENTFSFKSLDTILPEMVKSDPVHEERKVSVYKLPHLYFSEPLRLASVNNDSIKLYKDKEEQTILLKYIEENNTVELIPENEFDDGEFYEIKTFKTLTDKAGNPVNPVTIEFKTEDLTKPELISFVPQDNEKNCELDTVIKLKFSEIIDKNSLDDSIVITDGDKFIDFTSSINQYGVNVELKPIGLEKKKNYIVNIKDNLMDLAGNKLAKVYTIHFATILFDSQEIQNKLDKYSEYDEKKAITKIQSIIGLPYYENYLTKEQVAANEVTDRIPPRVIDFFPLKDMQNVPVNAKITAIISEDLKANTIREGIIITDGGLEEPFTFSFDRKFKKIEIIPAGNLKPDTTYSVTLKDSIKDSADNSLLTKMWKFKTAKDVNEIKIVSKLPKPVIDEVTDIVPDELLQEDIVEMKPSTLEDLREEDGLNEDDEIGDETSEKREEWAKKAVLNLRSKFAKQYAIITANPKVKPTRFELALIVRSIIKKVLKNQMNKLFRTERGVSDLILLFQVALEYEKELVILGVNMNDLENKLKQHKIPTAKIRDDMYKGIIKGIK